MRHRQTVQRTYFFAARQLLVGGASLFHRSLREQGYDGVDLFVDTLYPRQVCLHYLGGGEFAPADEPGHLRGV